MALKS